VRLAKNTKSVVPVSLCSRAFRKWTIMWNLLVSFNVRVSFSYKIKLTKIYKKEYVSIMVQLFRKSAFVSVVLVMSMIRTNLEVFRRN